MSDNYVYTIDKQGKETPDSRTIHPTSPVTTVPLIVDKLTTVDPLGNQRDSTTPTHNNPSISPTSTSSTTKDGLTSHMPHNTLTVPSTSLVTYTISQTNEEVTTHPAAEDTETRLVRLITSDYNVKNPLTQLQDKSLWSPTLSGNQHQTYKLSAQGFCHGYISGSAETIRNNLEQKPAIPNIDPDDLTYPYVYSCTNTSDTYLVPYALSLPNQQESKRSELRSGVDTSVGVYGDSINGLIYYMLPVSKMDLHMRVKDFRQQHFTFACVALDICGYTVIATQSDDTTIFYFVISPTSVTSNHVVVHLEEVCKKSLVVLLEEERWIFGVAEPVVITDTMYLVQVEDYHYSATYQTNSYCSSRILESFWGYFANDNILRKIGKGNKNS